MMALLPARPWDKEGREEGGGGGGGGGGEGEKGGRGGKGEGEEGGGRGMRGEGGRRGRKDGGNLGVNVYNYTPQELHVSTLRHVNNLQQIHVHTNSYTEPTTCLGMLVSYCSVKFLLPRAMLQRVKYIPATKLMFPTQI